MVHRRVLVTLNQQIDKRDRDELVILKLGGSVITEKGSKASLNRLLLEEIAKELAKVRTKLLLVHGAGSFGHPIAKKYNLHKGYVNSSQLRGVTETKRSMLSLTLMIAEILAESGVPVVPFLSSSCMIAEDGRLIRVDLEPFRIMLDLGLVPMCSGDVVADLRMGFSIVSGDQIAVHMADKLNARRVIFGCDVDGVFDSDPKKNPGAKLIRTITPRTLGRQMSCIGESTTTDVTKGMLGKIRESEALVARGGEVIVINLKKPDNLTKFLRGKSIRCTRFISDPVVT